MRFNRIPHGWEWAIKHALNNPEWWESRWDIWHKTTKKSLQAQTDKDFEVWAVFDRQLCWTFEHIDRLRRRFQHDPMVRVVMEEKNLTKSCIPYQEVCHDRYIQDENLILINLDCDDLLRKDTIAEMKKIVPRIGASYVFMDGFIWNIDDGRMFRYLGKGAPGPFWALNFPKHVCKSPDQAFSYMRLHGMDQEHFKMNHADIVNAMPPGMFLQTIHGANTTTAWENKATKGHLGEEIIGSAKDVILKKFGL